MFSSNILYFKIFCIIEEYHIQHKRKELEKGKGLTFLIFFSKYAIGKGKCKMKKKKNIWILDREYWNSYHIMW